MKLIKLFLAVFVLTVFIYNNSISQSSWIRQDSLSGYNKSITFVNGNTGFYSGNNKRIYKTTNAGLNWFELTNSDIAYYKNISCVNENIIFAATIYSVIYKSSNSGETWSIPGIVNSGNNLNSFKMFDAETGYLTNSTSSPSAQAYIQKTTNGGFSWNVIKSSTFSGAYNQIFCLNKDTVFVTTHTTVFRTYDGGNSWTEIFILMINQDGDLNSIKFLNSTTGFIAGKVYYVSGILYSYPIILKTTNGGLNWSQKIFKTYELGIGLNSIDFYNLNDGFAVGDTGCVFRTTNMGNNWTKLRKFPGKIFDVCLTNPNSAYIARSNGTIYATTNGGWEPPLPPDLIKPLNNSGYLNVTPSFQWDTVEYNSASFNLQISLDTNFIVNILDVNIIDNFYYNIPSGILAVNNTYYWRVKSNNPLYSSPPSQIWKFNTNTPLAPNLLLPINNDTTVNSSNIFNWTDVPSVTNYNLQISSDSLFTHNNLDTILPTTPMIIIPVNKLFVNTSYFWRVKGINVNGSGLWSEIWKFKTTNDSPILVTPENNDSGIVYLTLFDWLNYTGASSYRIQISLDSLFNTVNIDNNVYSSQFTLHNGMQQNKYYFWRVNAHYNTYNSFWSQIRRFKTSVTYTGINVLSDIPSEYKLYDNYPNPFNPNTKIKFDIPYTENVLLIIYNSLGQIVKTLINEKLLPGSYEVLLNSNTLSSGIYFYRFLSGKYINTKRMILLK